ncbi:ANK_REP_REGION domain-containing protein [Trichoderma simmonsii]|uniref:ANK_REP_REGION domain-containing protein n=1 Tax=Trichoderma simmonsii TaxID=1491479 RepID=A0A8G0LR72_9HYPO|nr:ANK_REP_REGION domain-containing protein [Trichoderma simmonsii]
MKNKLKAAAEPFLKYVANRDAKIAGELSHQDCPYDKRFLASIKFELQNGLNIGLRQEQDGLLLTMAIHQGFLESLQYLIEGGVDINQPYLLLSPLMHAAQFGKLECARILLDKGADKDWRDEKDDTAIIKAATAKQFEMVEFLLDEGADLMGGKYYRTNLARLCVESPQCLRKVLKRLPGTIQMKDESKITAIHNAAILCQFEAVKILTEFGANVNIMGPDKVTPLMDAARNGSQEIVQYLLEKGVDVNHQDLRKSSALHEAETAGMIDILVKGGAKVNAVDVDGNTALHRRVKAREPNLLAIKKLVEAGADVNAKDDSGCTPLMRLSSVKESSVNPITTYLRSKGARS